MLPPFYDIYFLIAFKILTMIGENTMFTASSIKKFIPIILAKMYVIVLVPPAHVAIVGIKNNKQPITNTPVFTMGQTIAAITVER